MIENKQVVCPVCYHNKTYYYIATNALMYVVNQERYVFNKCPKCDSVFLTNPVKQDRLNGYYTDSYLPYKGADAWGKHQSFVLKHQVKLDKKRVQFVKKFAAINQPLSLLDVGCGNPSFLNLAQEKIKAFGTGIDFSDNGWKINTYDNLQLFKVAIADFEPKNKFDIITLWHYLEHDYNLHETIDKLYKCLNLKGRLIIEVPDYDSITAKSQKQFWQGWHSPRHLTLLSKNGFSVLFDSKKWKIIKHYKYGTLDSFTLWWLGKMEQKKINWSISMENEFWPLVILKAVSFPVFLFEKFLPMGIQLVVIEKK